MRGRFRQARRRRGADWLDRPSAMRHGSTTGAIGRRTLVIRQDKPQSPLPPWVRPPRRPVAWMLALFVACWTVPLAARELTVALHDMLAPAALRDAVVRPFTDASGIPVDMQSWNGGIAALRARSDSPPPWDAVSLTGAEVLAACEAGLLEKLDWTALGGRERLLPGGASECGLGFALRALVLAWDREKLQGSPGWAEFGDVVKLPGRRGLRKQVRGTLEVALMADGVAPGEVYRQLRTEAGVERAFRKLEQLRPYLVWWQDEVEAARLLASGEVLMTSAPSAGIAEAVRQDGRRLAVQWTGAITSVAALAILRGAPNAPQAARLLSFAADPKIQAALPALAPLGPLARGALEGVAPELQALLPTGAAAAAAAIAADEAFWRDNLARLSQRFDAWLPR
jgi:putative spermidine/putrescine transport system substrate-binding protein